MENKGKMQIKSVEISNFRCFPHYKIAQFGAEVTLLIGKNGVGKSSLLKAIANLLSVYFSKNEMIGVRTLSAGNPDLGVTNIPPDEIYRNNRIVADFMECSATALFSGSELNWTIRKKATNSSLAPTQYRDAYKMFIHKIDKEGCNYPLIAFYYDSFPHISGKIGSFANKVLTNEGELIRNFGYYQWNSENGCTALWELQFLNNWDNLLTKKSQVEMLNNALRLKYPIELIELTKGGGDDNRLSPEDRKSRIEELCMQYSISGVNLLINQIELLEVKEQEVKAIEMAIMFVNNRLSIFLNDSGSIQPLFKFQSISPVYRGRKRVVGFEFENSQHALTIEQLPAGYRRLISIVFDISSRSLILNGADAEPTGVILIDEIDLHLHPSLEQSVVSRIKRTFPQIQFIVTTHSPLVLSNFKVDALNKILVMRESEGVYSCSELPNLYGVPYQRVVSDFMDTSERSKQIDTYVNSYIRLRLSGKLNLANEIYKVLKMEVGEDMNTINSEICMRLGIDSIND